MLNGLQGNISLQYALQDKGSSNERQADRITDDISEVEISDNELNMSELSFSRLVEVGRTEKVKSLLERGYRANGKVCDFLSIAITERHDAIIELLVQYKASLESCLSVLKNKQRLIASKVDRLKSDLSSFENSSSRRVNKRVEAAIIAQKKVIFTKLDTYNEQMRKCHESVKIFFDYAFGVDLEPVSKDLSFLKDQDIAGYNFVGVSMGGVPVTRQMLLDADLKNADEALVTYDQVLELTEAKRRSQLLIRLQNKFETQGRMVSENGVVNLVSLYTAAEKGLVDIVKFRLSCGVDPNESLHKIHGLYGPISIAADNGHFEIVKELAQHPKINLKSRFSAGLSAKAMGYTQIAEYILSMHTINDCTIFGTTPLTSAVFDQNLEEIERLLKLGADPNCPDDSNHTPYSKAKLLEHYGKSFWGAERAAKVTELIVKYGAKPDIREHLE